MCATGGDRPLPGAVGAPVSALAAPTGGLASVPLCMGTVVPRTGSPGMLSRATLDTSTACLGAVLLFDGGFLVPITAGTPGAGDNVAVAGPAPPPPVARPTACPVGTRDGSCPCRVVVEAGRTLVGWLAAPGEETPAPAPACGLPCVARPPGRAAALGGPSCSPLVLSGTNALTVTCGTRLPARQGSPSWINPATAPAGRNLPAASCLPALPKLWLPTEVVVLPVGERCSGWVAAVVGNAWHGPKSGGSSVLVLLAAGEMLPGSAGADTGARGCSPVSPACAGGRAGR